MRGLLAWVSLVGVAFGLNLILGCDFDVMPSHTVKVMVLELASQSTNTTLPNTDVYKFVLSSQREMIPNDISGEFKVSRGSTPIIAAKLNASALIKLDGDRFMDQRQAQSSYLLQIDYRLLDLSDGGKFSIRLDLNTNCFDALWLNYN